MCLIPEVKDKERVFKKEGTINSANAAKLEESYLPFLSWMCTDPLWDQAWGRAVPGGPLAGSATLETSQ